MILSRDCDYRITRAIQATLKIPYAETIFLFCLKYLQEYLIEYRIRHMLVDLDVNTINKMFLIMDEHEIPSPNKISIEELKKIKRRF